MMPAPRSMLFVSGEQVARFPKAMAAGADVVCIDLEDAVHPERKNAARRQVIDWLLAHPADDDSPRRAVRINAVRTLDGIRDVLALADSGLQLDLLLLPKVEAAADIRSVAAWLPGRVDGIVALIETALAVEDLASIARAGAPLVALMLGGADLSAELDARFDWDGLRHARGRLVNVARAMQLQAWDVPHVDVQDLDALAEETRRVIGLGFDCKTAIHPKQLDVIHAAFAPTDAEARWATQLLAALPDGDASGAFLFDGRMVDAPLIRKARRIQSRTPASR